MKLVTAIVRPEKVMDVIKALEESGYFAFSKWAISGRGKEKGIQVGDVLYQEMAKSMLYITVEDKEKDEVVDIIVNSAKSGEYGHYGDGKIFVSDIAEAYTISEETREEDCHGRKEKTWSAQCCSDGGWCDCSNQLSAFSRSFFADSSYMLSFSVLCSCVCSRLISPSVSSWHKQDNTLMHQSPGHIQRRTPYNF